MDGIGLAECVNDVTISVLCITDCPYQMINFEFKMRTNYMIALNAQWKAPWRTPKTDVKPNAKASLGNQLDNIKNLLGRTVKSVHNFLEKNIPE
jgi:hypothetical protein